MDQYLTPRGIELRKKVRNFMESIENEVKNYAYHINKIQLYQYTNTTEFPFHLVPKIQELGVNGFTIKDHGGPGLNEIDTWAIVYEMAKIDLSVSTFLMVHNSIGMQVVNYLGNEGQRARILPDCLKLKKIMCFGLTEPEYGSDASSLKTTAKKVEGGYLLNGLKRWIGNATFADYIVIWARNEAEGNKIQAFIVEKGADITLENVFVPDNNRLEHAKDFNSANRILEHSRVGVAWLGAASACGAYEAALKYVLNRKQFGKQVASFQATQLKLSKMLGQCEMMVTLCMRITELVNQNKTTIGQIGRAKAICTALSREVCATARELCGGNGIIIDNRVMKSFMDIEAIYTYEGTYEVNMLVSGREITGGIPAFK
ncbi:acyl-dehydrogenase [Stylonychia lemnae]|uniref:Acyl-dehydrogenase n=1 Tax=Stylonychia lemnae TaxID=5949 RepID=A0A078ANR0_STYLE|nr:acyl-dehydrogenase [Stylonychia lemnae]|eukprot:CDW83571.1 acyl-dehydrogenase [Stylonychia lemnae]